jgi:mannose-6-phosphate isomerase
MKECKKTPSVVYDIDGCKKEILISKNDTPCFSVERYILNNAQTDLLDGTCVYVVTEGEGYVTNEEGYQNPLKKGDYLFMPFSCHKKFAITTSNTITVAVCKPPEVNND